MVTLYKLPGDTFSIRFRDKVVMSQVPMDEAIRVMMIALDVPGQEILAAIYDMESRNANVAEFGANRTFVLSRSVNYQDN